MKLLQRLDDIDSLDKKAELAVEKGIVMYEKEIIYNELSTEFREAVELLRSFRQFDDRDHKYHKYHIGRYNDTSEFLEKIGATDDRKRI